MDNYLVSARKYRPDTFRSVVGQQALTTTLQHAIKNNQLAHAYLFCGPRGVGKTTCARIFAKTINCLHPRENGEACNECESCRSFNEQRSYNIMELDAASNNSVDDIRSLTEQVRIPPVLGKYKVYIIDEVHMLSQGAFNAFLKTLEEPPAYAVFILATTEKHKIIPTILSRCQIYDFHRISVGDIQDYLQFVAKSENISYEPEALNIIAMKADGGMRDALSVFDQVASFGEGKITYKGVIENLNILDYDYYFQLVEAVLQHQTAQALLLFNKVLSLGFEGQYFMTGLSSHLRDLLVSKDARTLPLLEVSDSIQERYRQQALACSFDFLVEALKLANECSLQYNQSKNKRLLVEICLIRLCQIGEHDPEGKGGKAVPLAPVAAAPAPAAAPATAPPTGGSPASPAIAPASASPTVSAPRGAAAANTAPVTAGSATAAQPSPKSAVTPAAHRPATPAPKRPAALSIKRQAQEAVAATAKEETPLREEHQPFGSQELTEAWLSFAGTVKDDPQIHSAMVANPPELKSESDFEFVVFHPNMERRMLEIKPQIEKYLREQLHNTHANLLIRVSVGDEKKRALTPQDQLSAMLEKNPAFASLSDQLGLELD